MIKAIIILSILFGTFCYALLTAVRTSADKDQYEAYLKYKERKKKYDHTDCQWR